jgi:hypothetical protein
MHSCLGVMTMARAAWSEVADARAERGGVQVRESSQTGVALASQASARLATAAAQGTAPV